MKKAICLCGCKEGELHKNGCSFEKCSICKKQKLQCNHILKDKQREPFLSKGFSCRRCGEFMPKLKMINNNTWKFICGVTYNEDCILCNKCMNFILKERRRGK
jgi:hypothetical protein